MGNNLQGQSISQNGVQRDLAPLVQVVVGLDANGNPSSGGIVTTPGSVTSTSSIVTGAGSIPIGAKGWTFTVLSGTPTFNGATSLPVGFSDSDINTVKTAIAYDATGGSAYLRIGS